MTNLDNRKGEKIMSWVKVFKIDEFVIRIVIGFS